MTNSLNVQGPLVLIAEDEALIGLDIVDTLLGGKYRADGPFASCAAALAWLKENKPDAAILDVSLRDGPSIEIARELRRRGIPFVVYTGCLSGGADAAFAGAPWLEKPILSADLLGALAGLFSRESTPAALARNASSPRPETYRQAA
jgi:DNA-binding response OmpR family regulator